jgi:hypothetical protein
MWSREKLLHPATLIATLALFVALSGVTYAAARIGTSQLANGAVTGTKLADGAVSSKKLARNAVTGSRLASNSVGVRNLVAGTAVAGNGSVQNVDQTVKDGASAQLFQIPQVGALSAACAGGIATASLSSVTPNATVTVEGVNAGSGSDVPFVRVATPGSATTVTGPPAGSGGVQSATWKAWSTDAGPVGNGATIWLATTAAGASCVVTGQMLETAGLPPGGL